MTFPTKENLTPLVTKFLVWYFWHLLQLLGIADCIVAFADKIGI